nr:hypothetical protein [Brevibacterium luteolum]
MADWSSAQVRPAAGKGEDAGAECHEAAASGERPADVAAGARQLTAVLAVVTLAVIIGSVVIAVVCGDNGEPAGQIVSAFAADGDVVAADVSLRGLGVLAVDGERGRTGLIGCYRVGERGDA